MKQTRVKKWFAKVGILALAMSWVVDAEAQVSTGVIEVTAQDKQEGRLPGVTVQATNTETGLQRVTVTDGQGSAVLQALPPGTYLVRGHLEGFIAARDETVVIHIGQIASLRLTMKIQLSDVITVTAEVPLVDVYKSDSSTNILPEQIAELPIADRDFEKLAFITPGVQRERTSYFFATDGPVIGGSGSAISSSIFVDGVDLTDQANGQSRIPLSLDSIREVRVIAGRFDSEIGGSAGGAMSIVTRTGTNQIHGSAFGFFRTDWLRAKGKLDQKKSDYRRYQAGITLGGPMVIDKSHYFASIEYVDEQDIVLFRPGGAFVDDAADVEHPFNQTLGLLSFDYQLSSSISWMAKLIYEDYDQENLLVGGVSDISNGQSIRRDSYNLTLGQSWVLGQGNSLNEARLQYGQRNFEQPTNSHRLEEWFSSGQTLMTGTNFLGDMIEQGEYWEVRDTHHIHKAAAGSLHDIKFGVSLFHVTERSVNDHFQEGQIWYLGDDRSIPLIYIFGVGSSDLTMDTDITSLFVQDNWRVGNLTVSAGLRYDHDRAGNNPNFSHPLVGDRHPDDNNIQPRLGFSWDAGGDGQDVLRGGVGLFTGRIMQYAALKEGQENGISGRIIRANLSLPGNPLDLDDLENSGVSLPPNIILLEDNLEAPEAIQGSLGYARRLGSSGLYLDTEVIYSKGDNEIVIADSNFGGNNNPVRFNPDYNQINMFTNAGRSEYKAMVLGLNGVLGGGHLLAASVTLAEKRVISDSYIPEYPFGWSSDPADLEAEWGRSGSDERFRVVFTGVFRLPWQLTLAPFFEYGSGQPWNHLLGYDYNGDGVISDRPPGVSRNSKDGPIFKRLSLRLTKTLDLGQRGQFDVIVEAFNLFDWTNYDVASVANGEYLSGPTLANPDQPYVENPDFGQYRSTLPPREIQIGIRYRF